MIAAVAVALVILASSDEELIAEMKKEIAEIKAGEKAINKG